MLFFFLFLFGILYLVWLNFRLPLLGNLAPGEEENPALLDSQGRKLSLGLSHTLTAEDDGVGYQFSPGRSHRAGLCIYQEGRDYRVCPQDTSATIYQAKGTAVQLPPGRVYILQNHDAIRLHSPMGQCRTFCFVF